ncbi:hypothetical protein ACFFSY_09855 [Paenibacillus aurantiacus]|uniref:Uncharacterized protein n=1 Tax=Paenibacillus aurantiacus TaxID=1936118 RepID=A0ABV5KLV9_9BACL
MLSELLAKRHGAKLVIVYPNMTPLRRLCGSRAACVDWRHADQGCEGIEDNSGEAGGSAAAYEYWIPKVG